MKGSNPEKRLAWEHPGKGITLGQGGDTAAELEAYDAVIARFGDSDDAQLQVRVAMAMFNKGNALGQGGDTTAALEAYDAVIARIGDSDDVQPAVPDNV